MTNKGQFLKERNRVTPYVSAPGDTNPRDATASLTGALAHLQILAYWNSKVSARALLVADVYRTKCHEQDEE